MKKTKQGIISVVTYTMRKVCKSDKVVILAFPLQTTTNQNNCSKHIALL